MIHKKKIVIAIFFVMSSYCIGTKIGAVMHLDASKLTEGLLCEFVGVCSIVGIVIIFLLLIGLWNTLDTLYTNWKSIRNQKEKGRS